MPSDNQSADSANASLRRERQLFAGLLLLLCACQAPGPSRKAEPPATEPAAPAAAAQPRAAAPEVRAAPAAGLPPPAPVRTREQLQRQIAERLLAANPEMSYRGAAPAVLLAVPVLQIELYGDGRIKRIEVLREPREAKDTIELAKRALHRAAPFGNVQRLTPPWLVTETFLFDDSRRFKPRSLD